MKNGLCERKKNIREPFPHLRKKANLVPEPDI